jgi:ABC-type sugar transport system substrate-binding protein
MVHLRKNAARKWGSIVLPMVLVTAMVAVGSGAGAGAANKPTSATGGAKLSAHVNLNNPTKKLCKLKKYKIGYDVFSDSQPFAVSLTQGLEDAAAKVGCVTIVKTVDNLSGPTAVANTRTLINEGINGYVDFQVLAAFQPAIEKLLKAKKIGSVGVVGAVLPGFPNVGLDPFNTEKAGAIAMATEAKAQFPSMVPYFLGGAEPASGAAVLARYKGAVAGIQSVYTNIPADHIIEVVEDGTATTAYNNTLSALSAVPAGSLVLVQAVNDEDTGGMFKAVQSRGFTDYFAESFGGDSYGLSQVCANPAHYAGVWDLNPSGWGPVLLSLVMMEMNHQKVPKLTNIEGFQVTAKSPQAGC